MDSAATATAESFVEDTYLKPRFGLIEFFRRARTDQLSLLLPELFDRNMTYSRLVFLDNFILNKPEYIEHVLLTNQANYRKSPFLRHILGPLLGEGLLISEGEFWRRQRRNADPAFHTQRGAGFVTAMASGTETLLPRWHTTAQPFDSASEMMALTLNVIARTMFSRGVSGDVEAVRRLTDVVVR